MAIHDRHYYRDAQRRPSGALAISALSVNTWLIVLCVAVFVFDEFLPVRLVPTDNMAPPSLAQVDQRLLAITFDVAPVKGLRKRLPGGSVWVYVKEKSSGNIVGVREVIPMRFLESYLHFSTALGFLKIEYCRFIGFQFLHAGLPHLLFNMVGLFFFGPIVEQHLGGKRYLAFYLLCGMFGAIMYLILNLGGMIVTTLVQEPMVVPGLLFSDAYTPLVGASAGIFGVLMAGAYLMPRAEVLLFFILPMRLRTLAYVLVAVALYMVITGGHNAGGEAGHLGGAIAGFYFIRRQHHLHGFFDLLGRVDPTSHHYRRTARQPRRRPAAPMNVAEVDRILDKISQDGLHSLTDEEKRILSEASRTSRGGGA